MYRTTHFFAVAVLAFASTQVATAAEGDQYFSWIFPPQDSTEIFNARINQILEKKVKSINKSRFARGKTCQQISENIADAYFHVAMNFFVGATRDWGYDFEPGNKSDYRKDYLPRAIYSDCPLSTYALCTPLALDPNVRADQVTFSMDKLAHFLTNGIRYYKRFNRLRARGMHELEAIESAVSFGIHQERTYLGWMSSGVFSMADLEANEQGFWFYYRLCEGESPMLARTPEGWVVQRPFDIREFVNPCWDESYSPNVYTEGVWEPTRRNLQQYCPLLKSEAIAGQRSRYAKSTRSCPTGYTGRRISAMIEAQLLPNPANHSIEAACGVTDGHP